VVYYVHSQETTMKDNIPSTPSELLAMQQGGIKDEINHEELGALDQYVRGEVLPELNPSMAQVLVLAKKLLEDLEGYHYDMIEGGDLDSYGRRIWKRDAKNVTKALMALRQVAEG
jgi:hypothetical protein